MPRCLCVPKNKKKEKHTIIKNWSFVWARLGHVLYGAIDI